MSVNIQYNFLQLPTHNIGYLGQLILHLHIHELVYNICTVFHLVGTVESIKPIIRYYAFHTLSIIYTRIKISSLSGSSAVSLWLPSSNSFSDIALVGI